jgi:hypothetical protein
MTSPVRNGDGENRRYGSAILPYFDHAFFAGAATLPSGTNYQISKGHGRSAPAFDCKKNKDP